MKMFDTQPKAGMPVRHSTFFKALVRMARAWESLKVHNGHVNWSNGMPTIVVDTSGDAAAGGLTIDYCYVGAQKVTIPAQTTDFLKITFGSSPSASWVAAMPETQDSDAVVFDVTKNRIYLSGEFGSG
jgi:hypothetical protein